MICRLKTQHLLRFHIQLQNTTKYNHLPIKFMGRVEVSKQCMWNKAKPILNYLKNCFIFFSSEFDIWKTSAGNRIYYDVIQRRLIAVHCKSLYYH